MPASCDPSQYGTFPDQQCDAGNFYTCMYSPEGEDTTTFVGCCQDSNVCDGMSNIFCFDGLAGAFLSNNPVVAAPFLSLNATWVASATYGHATQSSGATSRSVSSRPTNLAAIVGGAVGGFCVVVATVVGILWHRRRRLRRSQEPAFLGPVAAPAERMQQPYYSSCKPNTTLTGDIADYMA